jgi:hypothetical protein
METLKVSQSYATKSDFDPPSWTEQQFLAYLAKHDFE